MITLTTTNYNNNSGRTRAAVGINTATNPRTRIIRTTTGRTTGDNLGMRIIRFSSCIAPSGTLTSNRLSLMDCRRGPFLSGFGGAGGASLIPVNGTVLVHVNVCDSGIRSIGSVPSNTAVTVPGSPAGNNHNLLLLRHTNLLGLGSNINVGTAPGSIISGPGRLGFGRLRTTRLPHDLTSISTTTVAVGCIVDNNLSIGGRGVFLRPGSRPLTMVVVTTHGGSGSGRTCGTFIGTCRSRTIGGFVTSGCGKAVRPTFWYEGWGCVRGLPLVSTTTGMRCVGKDFCWSM